MKISLIIALLIFQCFQINISENGLYYGKVGGFAPPLISFVQLNDNIASVEIYQPLKGQIKEILIDTLIRYEENQSNIIFIGEKLYLENIKNDLILYPREQYNLQFRPINISLDASKKQLLLEYRNRAYLYKDYYKTISFLKDSIDIENGRNLPSEYERLLYLYGIDRIAKSLSNEKFIIRYNEIRLKIFEHIIREESQ